MVEPARDDDLVGQTVPVTRCETCDTAGVPGAGAIPWDIDATTDALILRARAGTMRELRHDVPLEDMVPLLESDMKYTIVSFVECLDCGRVLFWGLCIRGAPFSGTRTGARSIAGNGARCRRGSCGRDADPCSPGQTLKRNSTTSPSCMT